MNALEFYAQLARSKPAEAYPAPTAEARSYQPSYWDTARNALDQLGQYAGYTDLGDRTAETAQLLGTAAMFAPGLYAGPATGAARDAAMAGKLKELYPFADDFIHPAHGGSRLVQQFADDSATVFRNTPGARRYTPSGYRSMEWMSNAQGGRVRTSEDLADRLVGANEARMGIVRR
jgi:hypothetical protein